MLRRLCVAFTLLLAAVALRAAQAGEPPTARIMVNPVPAKVGPPYPPLIGGGPNIVGNELRLDAGGVRVWLEVQLADWDPNGDGSPGARFFQVTLDGTGLLDADINGDGLVHDDGDQEDIVLPVIPCDSYLDCGAAFGEADGEQCGSLVSRTCNAVYPDKQGTLRPDAWCAGGGCEEGSNAIITPPHWRVYGLYTAPFRPDNGTVRWGATAVYDVPPGAKGKYSAELDRERTYFTAGSFPFPEIPTLSKTGFVINILTGRCCYGFGTPAEGCVDSVTRAECGDDEPGPFVFTPEAFCPPDGPDCEPVTVACCHGDPFGPCTDHTPVGECQCRMCSWDQFRTCEEIECAPSPIPAASAWGLVVMTLLLMLGSKIVFAGSGVTHKWW